MRDVAVIQAAAAGSLETALKDWWRTTRPSNIYDIRFAAGNAGLAVLIVFETRVPPRYTEDVPVGERET